uniref:Uncharacterized protein n=1 Tax=Rhizoctonia solani TaxID=456999 RepID=N0ABU6_9AGAM|nr:hypothetical protein RSOL_m00800 [Rhizoctonia solani]AGK45405.1 hypothetical protein RSOL_m00800 [Rhizoctonia solani]
MINKNDNQDRSWLSAGGNLWINSRRLAIAIAYAGGVSRRAPNFFLYGKLEAWHGESSIRQQNLGLIKKFRANNCVFF